MYSQKTLVIRDGVAERINKLDLTEKFEVKVRPQQWGAYDLDLGSVVWRQPSWDEDVVFDRSQHD